MSDDRKLPPALQIPAGPPPANTGIVSPALKRAMIAMTRSGGALHDR